MSLDERRRAYSRIRKYFQTSRGRAARSAAAQRWKTRNPRQQSAQAAVAAAVRGGVLVKEPCEHADATCSGLIHAHHDDYTRPLDVRWLCASHHRRAHSTST